MQPYESGFTTGFEDLEATLGGLVNSESSEHMLRGLLNGEECEEKRTKKPYIGYSPALDHVNYTRT